MPAPTRGANSEKVGQDVGIGAAGVDEGHGAERLAEALAEFDVRLDHAGAAQRVVEGVARARTLVDEAAHRAAAAGIEQLVEGDAGDVRGRLGAERRAQRQHAAAGLGEIEIAAAGQPDLGKEIVVGTEIDIGRDVELEAVALGRIDVAVGLVHQH